MWIWISNSTTSKLWRAKVPKLQPEPLQPMQEASRHQPTLYSLKRPIKILSMHSRSKTNKWIPVYKVQTVVRQSQLWILYHLQTKWRNNKCGRRLVFGIEIMMTILQSNMKFWIKSKISSGNHQGYRHLSNRITLLVTIFLHLDLKHPTSPMIKLWNKYKRSWNRSKNNILTLQTSTNTLIQVPRSLRKP